MATVIPQTSIQDLVFKKSTPNILGALQSGLNLAGTFQEQQAAKRQEQALIGQQQLGQEVATSLLSGQANPQAMAQLLGQNPELAGQILSQAGIVDQQGRDQLARTAFEIESIPAGPQRDARIQQIGAQLEAQGRDPNLALGLIGLSPEQQNKKLQSMQLTAMTPQQINAIAQDDRNFGLEQQKFGLTQALAASTIADRQQTQARLTKKATDAAIAGVQIDAKGRQAINKDVTGLIKETVASVTAARSLEALQKTGTPAAQLAGIFKFMKSLDPTSVVREGEQNMARSVGGPMDRFVGAINQARGEGGLTQRAFRDMVATAKSIANSDIGSAETSVGGFLNTFEQTIPETFKASLLKRLPTPFVVPAGPKEAPDTVGTAVVSPASGASPVTIGRFQVEVLN